jgi:inner membrane protein
MDNFTHSLVGWALGQAGLKTKTRKGLAALVLGANMPDIDVFLGWVPWEPLAMHRGFTHSLVGGALIMPPILAGLLLLLDRWQVRRGVAFKSGLAMHAGWLVALCYIGAITHLLLDLQTTYSVQLFSPFDLGWYHADSLFIIDVWLWALLAGSIAWSRSREKRGGEWHRPVQGAIAVGLAYIAFNIGLSQTATESVARKHPDATAIFASPPRFGGGTVR